MKRPKKAILIEETEEPRTYIMYKIVCPHCHSEFIYNSYMFFKDVLMYLCPTCKNPIDLRKEEQTK